MTTTLGNVFSLTAAASGVTADVWVAKNGSAANDGLSESTPKLTIAQGIGVLQTLGGGKTMMIRSGTYAEGITGGNIPSGLSNSQHTIIKAYPGETVTLTGHNGIACIHFNSSRSWITFDGLTLDRQVSQTINGPHGVKTEGGGGVACTQLRFINMESRNWGNMGIGLFDYPGSGHEIGWCHIHHNGNNAQFDHGIYCSVPNCWIHDNDVHDNSAMGIQVYKDADPRPSNCIVERNLFYNHFGTNSQGIILQGSGHICRNNIVYNNNSHGIHPYYTSSSGTRVYHNTIANNGGAGINLSTSTGVICRNNLFQTGDGISGGSGSTVSNNVTQSSSFFQPGGWELAAGSPAINAGFDLTGFVADDIDGLSRPQGAGWDCGAYEYKLD